MKNNLRFLFGLLSGLLLSAGLAGAANRLDPLSQQSLEGDALAHQNSAPDCSTNCDLPAADCSTNCDLLD